MPRPAPKIKISPSQGLLLLMQYYHDDESKLSVLKKLYLNDIPNSAIHQQIMTQLADPKLSDYRVSTSPETIMEDPVRRYFETHLAYETLKHGLRDLDDIELITHLAGLKGLLIGNIPSTQQHTINEVLAGNVYPQMNDFEKEYAIYIHKINNGQLFQDFTTEELEKIKILISCAYIGVIIAQKIKLPLDIYGTGIYASQRKGKVLIDIQENKTTRNPHLGLLKGYMPIPIDDIATQEKVPNYLKPSDISTFDTNSIWVRYALATLVNPFSNSISGTILCQLRTMAQIRNENGGESYFTHQEYAIHQFFKYFIATMVYGSGGHSLLEYSAPLQILQSRKEFETTPHFDQISLKDLFLENNEPAFESALKKTLRYNQTMLQRQQVLAEIDPQSQISTPQKPLFQPGPSITKITNLKENYLNHTTSFFKPKNKQKVNLINRQVARIIEALKEYNLNKATILIEGLKNDVQTHFGTTNFFGEEKKSWQLLKDIEKEIKKNK